MRRTRAWTALTSALIALTLTGAGCGGDDDADPAPAPAEAPSTKRTPPSDPGALPPKFTKCMADQGYDVGPSFDLHSAPPDVLQACFSSLHSVTP